LTYDSCLSIVVDQKRGVVALLHEAGDVLPVGFAVDEITFC
jgi:hypothetical protein